MTHGSLFSGIGGFDLAAEWMGWENIFHCEWESFPRKVLKYYWPNATSYGDIKKTDFTIHRGQIDILTGGFPCQPYSTAGKRLGKEDDRHLWPEMLRAIREVQPTWVVGENVRGLINWNGGLVFDEVQADLEAEGYEVQPFLLPACAVNAPHRRDRIWFVAYSRNNGHRNRSRDDRQETSESKSNKGERQRIREKSRGTNVKRDAPNPDSNGQQGRRLKNGKKETKGQVVKLCMGIRERAITNDNGDGQPRKEHRQKESRLNTKQSGPGGWENFPTQPPVLSGNDGISSRLDGITFPKWRNESIKAAGNAIVPQVAIEIFKAIEQYE